MRVGNYQAITRKMIQLIKRLVKSIGSRTIHHYKLLERGTIKIHHGFRVNLKDPKIHKIVSTVR